MPTASCHCGAIRIEVESIPTELNECQCSICYSYGARWANYRPDQVRIDSDEPNATEMYMWSDRIIEFHRCSKCGCVTHWAPVDMTETRMGVNSRMMDRGILKDVPVRQGKGPG